MKISFTFKWFDFWIGFYFDNIKKILYFCPVPMLVIMFEKKSKVMSYCRKCGRPLKKKVIIEKYDEDTGEPELFFFSLICPATYCRYPGGHTFINFVGDRTIDFNKMTMKEIQIANKLYLQRGTEFIYKFHYKNEAIFLQRFNKN